MGVSDHHAIQGKMYACIKHLSVLAALAFSFACHVRAHQPLDSRALYHRAATVHCFNTWEFQLAVASPLAPRQCTEGSEYFELHALACHTCRKNTYQRSSTTVDSFDYHTAHWDQVLLPHIAAQSTGKLPHSESSNPLIEDCTQSAMSSCTTPRSSLGPMMVGQGLNR